MCINKKIDQNNRNINQKYALNRKFNGKKGNCKYLLQKKDKFVSEKN